MATKGIYIQNKTANRISYTAPDKAFSITVMPFGEVGDTQYIPENYSDDMGIRRLVTKGICKVVQGGLAVEREKEQFDVAEAKREERRARVADNVDNTQGDDLLSVQCSAVTSTGKQCSRKVTVAVRDTVDGKPINPVYCRQHKQD